MLKYFIKRWVIKHWGKRCPDFEKSCGCCRAWKYYDYIFDLEYFLSGENPGCEYWQDFGLNANVCKGNEPYSCKRAKAEGLCHIERTEVGA